MITNTHDIENLFKLKNILDQNKINRDVNSEMKAFEINEPTTHFYLECKNITPGISYRLNPTQLYLMLSDEEIQMILDNRLKQIDIEKEYQKELEQLKVKYGNDKTHNCPWCNKELNLINGFFECIESSNHKYRETPENLESLQKQVDKWNDMLLCGNRGIMKQIEKVQSSPNSFKKLTEEDLNNFINKLYANKNKHNK